MTAIFGHTPEGDDVLACTLRNGGTVATILTWGAVLQDFRLAGVDYPLILGGRDMAAYLGPMQYFGAIVGPVANRIEGGRFVLDGREHHLERNENNRTTLHAGVTGFSERNWSFEQITSEMCRLTLTHPDGLGGFPGAIHAAATYRLTDQGALEVEVAAETDRPTFFSPAFHGYWNLTGEPDLSGHSLEIPADHYLPVDADQIPVMLPQPVAGTAFDYRISRSIDATLDHNFCLPPRDGLMQQACVLKGGGLRLEVMTDQPGVQVYSGQHIDTGAVKGLTARAYGAMAGLAIEPQFWPNTPNQPSYPSCLLLPGQVARHRSQFSVTRSAGG